MVSGVSVADTGLAADMWHGQSEDWQHAGFGWQQASSGSVTLVLSKHASSAVKTEAMTFMQDQR